MRNKDGRLLIEYITALETLDLINKLLPIVGNNNEVVKLIKGYEGVNLFDILLYLHDVGFVITWDNLEISNIINSNDPKDIEVELKESQTIMNNIAEDLYKLIIENETYIKFEDLEKIITDNDELEMKEINNMTFIMIYQDDYGVSLYRIYDEELEKFKELIELLGV